MQTDLGLLVKQALEGQMPLYRFCRDLNARLAVDGTHPEALRSLFQALPGICAVVFGEARRPSALRQPLHRETAHALQTLLHPCGALAQQTLALGAVFGDEARYAVPSSELPAGAARALRLAAPGLPDAGAGFSGSDVLDRLEIVDAAVATVAPRFGGLAAPAGLQGTPGLRHTGVAQQGKPGPARDAHVMLDGFQYIVVRLASVLVEPVGVRAPDVALRHTVGAPGLDTYLDIMRRWLEYFVPAGSGLCVLADPALAALCPLPRRFAAGMDVAGLVALVWLSLDARGASGRASLPLLLAPGDDSVAQSTGAVAAGVFELVQRLAAQLQGVVSGGGAAAEPPGPPPTDEALALADAATLRRALAAQTHAQVAPRAFQWLLGAFEWAPDAALSSLVRVWRLLMAPWGPAAPVPPRWTPYIERNLFVYTTLTCVFAERILSLDVVPHVLSESRDAAGAGAPERAQLSQLAAVFEQLAQAGLSAAVARVEASFLAGRGAFGAADALRSPAAAKSPTMPAVVGSPDAGHLAALWTAVMRPWAASKGAAVPYTAVFALDAAHLRNVATAEPTLAAVADALASQHEELLRRSAVLGQVLEARSDAGRSSVGNGDDGDDGGSDVGDFERDTTAETSATLPHTPLLRRRPPPARVAHQTLAQFADESTTEHVFSLGSSGAENAQKALRDLAAFEAPWPTPPPRTRAAAAQWPAFLAVAVLWLACMLAKGVLRGVAAILPTLQQVHALAGARLEGLLGPTSGSAGADALSAPTAEARACVAALRARTCTAAEYLQDILGDMLALWPARVLALAPHSRFLLDEVRSMAQDKLEVALERAPAAPAATPALLRATRRQLALEIGFGGAPAGAGTRFKRAVRSLLAGLHIVAPPAATPYALVQEGNVTGRFNRFTFEAPPVRAGGRWGLSLTGRGRSLVRQGLRRCDLVEPDSGSAAWAAPAGPETIAVLAVLFGAAANGLASAHARLVSKLSAHLSSAHGKTLAVPAAFKAPSYRFLLCFARRQTVVDLCWASAAYLILWLFFCS